MARDGAPTREETSASPSEAEAAIIDEEVRLLAVVRQAIADAAGLRRRQLDRRREVDGLQRELSSTSEDDLPAITGQLHELASQLRASTDRALPDPVRPYFAHLRLRIGRRERDLLVGSSAFVDLRRKVTVIDWQTAPLARVFYDSDEGEAFEEEVGQRLIEGEVLVRRVLSIDDLGTLSSIEAPGLSLRRCGPDRWCRQGPAGRRASRFGLDLQVSAATPQVSALLDADQLDALYHSERRPLLILGGAGCGKTTVALHRVSLLRGHDPERFAPASARVIVPTAGLVAFSQRQLGELGLEGAELSTFDDWVVARAREAFAELRRLRINRGAPAEVVGFKRHPAMGWALERVVDQVGRDLIQRLDRRLGARGAALSTWSEVGGRSLRHRLDRAVERLRRSAPELFGPDAPLALRQARQRLRQPLVDARTLLGDDELLEGVVERSAGDLRPSQVEAMRLHLRRQLAATAEQRYAHVDPERRRALDGRPLDEGTPDEVAGTVDLEDLPLMFELLLRCHGRCDALTRVSHLVVDEAQELAPVELSLLARAVERRGVITAAGDEAQQVDPTSPFRSWPTTLEALGATRARKVRLQTTYRCTRQVAQFGHELLGPLAPDRPPRALVEGAPVFTSGFGDAGLQAVALAATLEELIEGAPRARVAVITRSSEAAEGLAQALDRLLPVRLVEGGQFSFRPGVEVAEVGEVKGLEFDAVIVPDASAEVYPDEPGARRALYVAVTRAIHQLWVSWVGRPSPLIPQTSRRSSNQN